MIKLGLGEPLWGCLISSVWMNGIHGKFYVLWPNVWGGTKQNDISSLVEHWTHWMLDIISVKYQAFSILKILWQVWFVAVQIVEWVEWCWQIRLVANQIYRMKSSEFDKLAEYWTISMSIISVWWTKLHNIICSRFLSFKIWYQICQLGTNLWHKT